MHILVLTRNINGEKQQILIYSGPNADINSIGTGPFETTEAVNFLRAGEGGFWTNRISLTFNASRVVQTSEVNRPNTVLALPIYIY